MAKGFTTDGLEPALWIKASFPYRFLAKPSAIWLLAELAIIDCGTSGGVWGIERGYCMMIGGAKEAVDHLDPIFSALAPGLGDDRRARRAARTAIRARSAATFTPVRPAPGTSSRWCITASSTA